ncbi:hypothetical protein [Brevundimonas sp.]|uniref:hypothetical protein n=1 Tax=Brevundimonas sp. TaxID=1871086 RepID=UPI00356722FC
MAFPIPIFALEDWAAVWVFPLIMAVVFGVFLRDRDVIKGGDRRPMVRRFLPNFVLYASIWIPFQIISDAVERGAEAQGFDSPGLLGFGIGLSSGLVVFFALVAIAPVRSWLGYKRNPFESAGKS